MNLSCVRINIVHIAHTVLKPYTLATVYCREEPVKAEGSETWGEDCWYTGSRISWLKDNPQAVVCKECELLYLIENL